MKTIKKYFTPEIELIHLDREISLQLQSDNQPTGEPDESDGWSASNHSDFYRNDPYQSFKA